MELQRLDAQTACERDLKMWRDKFQQHLEDQDEEQHRVEQAEVARRIKALEEVLGSKAGKIQALREALAEKSKARESLGRDVKMWKAQYELAARMKGDVEKDVAHFKEEFLGRRMREKQEEYDALRRKQADLEARKTQLGEEAQKLEREIQAQEAQDAARAMGVADLRREVVAEAERTKANLTEAFRREICISGSQFGSDRTIGCKSDIGVSVWVAAWQSLLGEGKAPGKECGKLKAKEGMILVIQFLVRLKFHSMQLAMAQGGALIGILALMGVSTAYALCGVCLIQLCAPACGGSGIPENKAFLNGGAMPNLYSRRTLGVRACTNVLANAAGFPVGREGPMVTMGSNLAFLLCERLIEPLVREWVRVEGHRGELVDEHRLAHSTRISCTVGGACAIAVIFNAPFGGLLYMFEEVTSLAWPGELTFRVFVATMLCSIISYGLCYVSGSEITEFVIYAETSQDKTWHWGDVPIFVALSAVVGVLTSLHTRGMLGLALARQRLKQRLRRLQPAAVIIETALYASLCAFASGAVSLLADCTKEGESGLEYVAFNCAEGEYNPIASLLVATSHSSVKLLFSGNNAGEIRGASSLLAFLTYTSLNIGLAGLPVPGGAFTATMLMGGLFGRFVGAVMTSLHFSSTVSGVYAVVGSAAMLCGFKQMTLASVLIVVECVNDLSLAPIVMLGVAVSMAVNWSMNERGHDEEVIHRRQLPFLEPEPPKALDPLVALDLCGPPTLVLTALETGAEYIPVRAKTQLSADGAELRADLAAEMRQFQSQEAVDGEDVGKRIFKNLFEDDIKKQARLEDLWSEARPAPAPLGFEEALTKAERTADAEGSIQEIQHSADLELSSGALRDTEVRKPSIQRRFLVKKVSGKPELEAELLRLQAKVEKTDKEVQDGTGHLNTLKARNRNSLETLQKEKVRKNEELQKAPLRCARCGCRLTATSVLRRDSRFFVLVRRIG
ncbi:unnamed protein product [Effrenium voratum]|nr:unnamed protein product [Effrenium voratum]